MSWGQSNAGSLAVQQQQQQQQNVTQAVNQINQTFSGFGPSFYNQAGQDYTNWAAPQVQQQYQQNEQSLQDKLANQGLTNSSASEQEQGQLKEALAQAQEQVGNTAQSQVQSLQQQVAQEKAGLIEQANVANDPLSVAQQAISTAAGVQAPSITQPLGNLFQGFANTYLGSQLANTYNPTLYSSFLYNPSSGGGGGSIGAGLGSSSTVLQ